jgi:hypothetical protein
MRSLVQKSNVLERDGEDFPYGGRTWPCRTCLAGAPTARGHHCQIQMGVVANRQSSP